MRKLFSTVAALILAANLWAGVPQGFSFQAVVRNAQGELVQNSSNVSVKVSIMKDAADDSSVVYAETATAETNANGLMSLQIGNGTAISGSFDKIDWAQGTFFVKTEIDIEGGENYSISSVQQLLSVPFAMYAGNVPTKVSELENDAKFVSTDTLKAYAANINILKNTIMLANYVNADTLANYVNADTLANYVNTETLANYVSTKTLNSYAKTDQNISSFNNDANYVTSSTLKSYAKSNQNISSFNNDAKYISEDTLNAYAQKDTLNYYALKSELPDGVDLSTYLHNGSNISRLNNDAKYVKEGDNISNLNNDAKYLTKTGKIDNAANADYATSANKATQYIGDMPLAKVTVKVVDSYNVATASFLGQDIKNGSQTFVVPAYSPVFLSVALSKYTQAAGTNYTPYEYTYSVKINDEYFDNTGFEYDRANEKVYNSLETYSLNNYVNGSYLLSINSYKEEEKLKYKNNPYVKDKDNHKNKDEFYLPIVDNMYDYNCDGTDSNLGDNRYDNNKKMENPLSIGVSDNENLFHIYKGNEGLNLGGAWIDENCPHETLMGISHIKSSVRSHYDIYAHMPNWIYRNSYTTLKTYKVGRGYEVNKYNNEYLNADMKNQTVGPFPNAENTITITIMRAGGEQIAN